METMSPQFISESSCICTLFTPRISSRSRDDPCEHYSPGSEDNPESSRLEKGKGRSGKEGFDFFRGVKASLVHAGADPSVLIPVFAAFHDRRPEGKEIALGGSDRVDSAAGRFFVVKDARSVRPFTDADEHPFPRQTVSPFGRIEREVLRDTQIFFRRDPNGARLTPAASSAAEAFKPESFRVPRGRVTCLRNRRSLRFAAKPDRTASSRARRRRIRRFPRRPFRPLGLQAARTDARLPRPTPC